MTILGHRDEYAKKLGLPITARFNHSPSEIDRVANDLQAMRGYDREKAEEVAKAQLDAIKHRDSAKKTIFVVKEHNWRRKFEIASFFILMALVLFFATKGHAQSTVVRGAAKGTTPANNTTATSTDPNHTGLDVNVLNGGSGGTASGFGAAFPGTGTAAGASDGVNMQPLKVDGSQNLKVNCAVGCAGGSTTPSDAFANPTTAGLQFAFMASWNGATWDRIKGDTTNGLWVNCKSGCAGGSSTPADTFATPTTAGLSMSFPMLWNGATFDRQYGDKTNGAWVNIKNAALAVTGTFWQATQPVSGTFWQATQPVSGTFWQATQPVSGTVTTTPPSNASTNVAQINAVTPLMGNGVTGTGSQRVTIASDNTAFGVNATLSAETTKVIGTVNMAAGQTIGITANSSVNVAQINAVTPLMGNGTTGTGSPRVTVSSDNTPFQVKILGAGGATMDGTTAPGTTPTNGLAVLGGYATTLPTLTTGQSADLPTDPHARPYVVPVGDTATTSYHASVKFAASSTTDNAVLPGNATNTVELLKVTVTCTQTTAGQINVELLKRSAADTSGTAANMTVIPDDSSYAAGVSVPKSYTGTGPTVGTPIGDLDNAQIGCMASGTATPNDVYIFKPAKPIVLRGTAQMVAINVGNAALTGGNLTVTFEWIETTTP